MIRLARLHAPVYRKYITDSYRTRNLSMVRVVNEDFPNTAMQSARHIVKSRSSAIYSSQLTMHKKANFQQVAILAFIAATLITT